MGTRPKGTTLVRQRHHTRSSPSSPPPSDGLSLACLSVETLPTEGEALSVARVAERATLERLLFGNLCLVGRDALAAVHTEVVCLIPRWCIFLHIYTYTPHCNKSCVNCPRWRTLTKDLRMIKSARGRNLVHGQTVSYISLPLKRR